MTRKQLEGLQHCPDKRVQQVVEAALDMADRLEEAETAAVNAQVKAASFARKCRDVLERRKEETASQVRELQEKLAAKEMDFRILVMLHRDGHVELWSKANLPVKFAHWPDLGKSGEDEAEEYVLSRLPPPYRSIYDSGEGKRIGAGSCKGCNSRGEFRYVQGQVALIKAMKELEAGGLEP